MSASAWRKTRLSGQKCSLEMTPFRRRCRSYFASRSDERPNIEFMRRDVGFADLP